jgi:hypothetical protein
MNSAWPVVSHGYATISYSPEGVPPEQVIGEATMQTFYGADNQPNNAIIDLVYGTVTISISFSLTSATGSGSYSGLSSLMYIDNSLPAPAGYGALGGANCTIVAFSPDASDALWLGELYAYFEWWNDSTPAEPAFTLTAAWMTLPVAANAPDAATTAAAGRPHGRG